MQCQAKAWLIRWSWLEKSPPGGIIAESGGNTPKVGGIMPETRGINSKVGGIILKTRGIKYLHIF
ncbi:hypothetical protein [Neobacillus niacini]|uniref:hypothetical protein n=1 Tax=Neobacillus niacini TaxID=86668 RepID=UPI002FFE6699